MFMRFGNGWGGGHVFALNFGRYLLCAYNVLMCLDVAYENIIPNFKSVFFSSDLQSVSQDIPHDIKMGDFFSSNIFSHYTF